MCNCEETPLPPITAISRRIFFLLFLTDLDIEGSSLNFLVKTTRFSNANLKSTYYVTIIDIVDFRQSFMAI